MFHGQTLKCATSDYDQRHVIAFRPISAAARSWSYDKNKLRQFCHIYSSFYDVLVLVLSHVTAVQWENECIYESATVAQFHDWLTDDCQSDNPFKTYKRNKHWCYADYKHMVKLFATEPDILKVFLVSTFLTHQNLLKY